MQQKKKSFCRNCGALCAMDITLEGNRLISASPDGSVSPYGAYMCAKGHASIDFHNGSENRLLSSLKRQESGEFVPVSASIALDEIADKISSLIEKHGPRSVAVYHGTAAYRSVLGGLLERSLIAAIDSPNFFSTMTIDQSAKWVTSGRMGLMASGKPSTRDIDLAVIAGNNPIVSHQTFPFAAGESGAPGRAFADAKARGMRMIVIDPRKTETARYADLLIQPLPGQDAAIFAAIAHILLRDRTYNKAFCDRFVTQLDVLEDAVALYTPELAAERADVPVEQIEQAAKWIGEASRPFVGSGSGPSMSAHSNLNDHMIEVVNALVGGYKRAGDLLRNPGTLNPRTTVETVVPASRSWEKGVKCLSADIGKIFGEFPSALIPQEIQNPGPDKIRALIVFGGNPIMAVGDPDRAIPAFNDLELLVSLDSRMNETADLSHYVIAASQPFERHDVSIPGDSLYPTAFAQYAPPIVEKPEGVIDDWAFFWGIASRMNISLKLKYWNYGLDFDSIPGGMDLGTEQAPDPEEMIRYLCKDSVVPFDDLRDNPQGVRPDLPDQYVLSAPEDNGARLELCPTDIEVELNMVLNEKPDGRFRYQVTCRRILESINSAYLDSERSRKKYPINWSYMNPEDMAEEGIRDGDDIQITSEAGQIKGVARAEDKLRRGVISMTHMFGGLSQSTDPVVQGGSYTGRLTSLQACLEPINFMPRFSGIPVNIEPVVESVVVRN